MSDLPSIEDELSKIKDDDLLKHLEESAEAATEVEEEVVAEVSDTEETETVKSDAEILADTQGISVDDAEKALKTGYDASKFDPNDPKSKSVMEYNRLGEVIDKFENAVQDVRRKDDVIKHLVEKFNKKEELAYQRAIRDLEAKRAEAVEEGDVENFTKLDKEIDLQRKELVDLQSPVQNNPADDIGHMVTDFEKRNIGWYNDDTFDNSQMKEFAIKYDEYLARTRPQATPADNLKAVELEVRKKFPNHVAFKNQARESAPMMATNEAKRGDSGSKPTVRDLSAFQRQVFSEIHKADKSYTVEKYLQEMG